MCFPRICLGNDRGITAHQNLLMRRIHVLAGVITNPSGQILIAKRPDSAHQGGLWEFPGGKLEAGEERLTGLRRELQEELGISVVDAHPLIDIRHDYSDKSIRLDVWKVTRFSGEAHGAEGQAVRWVEPHEMADFDFPAANQPILSAARLPDHYLITPDTDELSLFTGLERAKAKGIRLVQLRQTQLECSEYQVLAAKVVERFGGDFQWLFKGNTPPPWPNSGWHLTSAQLRNLWQTNKKEPEQHPNWPLAASCHNAEELRMAMELGVDFVTLSPMSSTRSHPCAEVLGWDAAQSLIRAATLPVYLLGGMAPEQLKQAQACGAQGVAGISAFWPQEK